MVRGSRCHMHSPFSLLMAKMFLVESLPVRFSLLMEVRVVLRVIRGMCWKMSPMAILHPLGQLNMEHPSIHWKIQIIHWTRRHIIVRCLPCKIFRRWTTMFQRRVLMTLSQSTQFLSLKILSGDCWQSMKMSIPMWMGVIAGAKSRWSIFILRSRRKLLCNLRHR